MYNRTEIILEAYPYEFTDITKGRGVYFCHGKDGSKKILKEFSGSAAKAELLERFLCYLNERGCTAEQIVRTKEGEALFTDIDETKYYMRTWFDGRECDTRNREDILCAVRKLAQFHIDTAGFQEELPAVMCKDAEYLGREYARHTRELHKVRNYIKAKKKRNEFETDFLNEYDYYIAQADEAAGRLSDTQEPSGQFFGICHGDYSQHNLLFTAKGPVIINYERFCQDAYISDFAHFFRKIMEKHNWNTGLGMDMIHAYDKVRGFGGWELRQLSIRMSYPEKFWKVANHYFNSKKSWANNRDGEKLAKIRAQEQERAEFLKILYYFVQG
ncbi:MAG: CotS family spore coat protein [Eubacterium sp.]|nr:CotS family spore coat protein [Eubacterium sp.]